MILDENAPHCLIRPTKIWLVGGVSPYLRLSKSLQIRIWNKVYFAFLFWKNESISNSHLKIFLCYFVAQNWLLVSQRIKNRYLIIPYCKIHLNTYMGILGFLGKFWSWNLPSCLLHILQRPLEYHSFVTPLKAIVSSRYQPIHHSAIHSLFFLWATQLLFRLGEFSNSFVYYLSRAKYAIDLQSRAKFIDKQGCYNS